MVSTTGGGWVREFSGLSTDEKPTENVPNGSIFLEMDTSKVFIFDYENTRWLEM